MIGKNKLSLVVIPGYFDGNNYAGRVAEDGSRKFSSLWFTAEAKLMPAGEVDQTKYRDAVLLTLGKAVGYSGLVVANGSQEPFEKGQWLSGLGETSLGIVEAAVKAGYPAALMHRPFMDMSTGLDLAPFDVADRERRLERLDLYVLKEMADLPAVPLMAITPR